MKNRIKEIGGSNAEQVKPETTVTAFDPDARNSEIGTRRKKFHRRKGKIPGQGKKKDTATSIIFRNSRNFAEVFNHTLFADIPIKADHLSVEDTKETAVLRVTKETHTSLEQFRDVVKTLNDGQPLAILGIENQSEMNYQMPFRVFEFDFVNYALQIQEISDKHEKEKNEKKRGQTEISKEDSNSPDLRQEENSESIAVKTPSGAEYLSRFYGEDRIVPCITLVIYWGEESWRGPRKLSDMFVENPWSSIASDYEMHLLEVNQMTCAQIEAYEPDLRAVFGFVRYAKDKKGLQNFIDSNSDELNGLSGTVYAAIAELTHSPELKRIAAGYEESEVRYDMCQALREMMEDSKKEGIKEGIKEERANTERERQRADIAEQMVKDMQAEIMRLKTQLQYASQS